MPDLLELLQPNWAQSVSLDTVWETEVSVSRVGGVEERTGLITQPRRILNYLYLACDPSQVVDLVRYVSRSSGEQTLIPLPQDAARLPNGHAGGSALFGDFSNRRFHSGRFAAVVDPVGGVFDVVVMQSASPSVISLSVPLVPLYPAGSFVVPLLSTDIQLDQQRGSVLTAGVVQNQLTFREVIGDVGLPPLAPVNDLAGFSVFDGLPVLPTLPDFSAGFRLEQPRIGDQYTSGQGRLTTVRSPFPRLAWSLRLFAADRLAWHSALRFFSGRRGRLLPFYAVLPVSLWDIVAVGVGFVDVKAHDDAADFARFLTFAAIGPDGTQFLSKITSIVPAGSNWRLLLTDTLPASWNPGNIRWGTAAVKARFSRDSFREIWDTTECAQATLELQSLIDEKDFASSIPGSGSGLPGGSPVYTGHSGSAATSPGGSPVVFGIAEESTPGGGSPVVGGTAQAPTGKGGSPAVGGTSA